MGFLSVNNTTTLNSQRFAPDPVLCVHFIFRMSESSSPTAPHRGPPPLLLLDIDCRPLEPLHLLLNSEKLWRISTGFTLRKVPVWMGLCAEGHICSLYFIATNFALFVHWLFGRQKRERERERLQDVDGRRGPGSVEKLSGNLSQGLQTPNLWKNSRRAGMARCTRKNKLMKSFLKS